MTQEKWVLWKEAELFFYFFDYARHKTYDGGREVIGLYDSESDALSSCSKCYDTICTSMREECHISGHHFKQWEETRIMHGQHTQFHFACTYVKVGEGGNYFSRDTVYFYVTKHTIES